MPSFNLPSRLQLAQACISVKRRVYHTAYGGPFTVYVDLFILPFAVSGIVTTCAVVVHLLTRLPYIRQRLQPIRYWTPVLIPVGIGLIIFASRLGLRHVEPVSNYKLMEPVYWWIAYFLILFPIVNFPLFRSTRRESTLPA